jgi:hypothetical protein
MEFFFLALCVWRNYMFRSCFLSVRGFLLLLLLGFWSSIFAWFFFWCVWVCVKKPTCTDPAFLVRILLLIWVFWVRIFAAAFRFSGGGILSYFYKKKPTSSHSA